MRTKRIAEKIELAKKSSKGLMGYEDTDNNCDPPSTEGCIIFIESYEAYMDISHCVAGVTDECLMIGRMQITICVDIENGDVEVNFEELDLRHTTDCIIDFDEHHNDPHHSSSWVCEYDVFYNHFYNVMMEIVLNTLNPTLYSCNSENSKVISRYSRELCVIPCIQEDGLFSTISLEQCGETTACCVQLDNWCQDEEGNIQKTQISKIQIGECGYGVLSTPCPAIKGIGVFETCRARSCSTE